VQRVGQKYMRIEEATTIKVKCMGIQADFTGNGLGVATARCGFESNDVITKYTSTNTLH